jgi:hypothetical protein
MTMRRALLVVAVACSLAGCGGGGQSLSYKDGYVIGVSDYHSTAGSWTGVADCQNETTSARMVDGIIARDHSLPPKVVRQMQSNDGLPPGDNEPQWYAGCLAGWDATGFSAAHPGAN